MAEFQIKEKIQVILTPVKSNVLDLKAGDIFTFSSDSYAFPQWEVLTLETALTIDPTKSSYGVRQHLRAPNTTFIVRQIDKFHNKLTSINDLSWITQEDYVCYIYPPRLTLEALTGDYNIS